MTRVIIDLINKTPTKFLILSSTPKGEAKEVKPEGYNLPLRSISSIVKRVRYSHVPTTRMRFVKNQCGMFDKCFLIKISNTMTMELQRDYPFFLLLSFLFIPFKKR